MSELLNDLNRRLAQQRNERDALQLPLGYPALGQYVTCDYRMPPTNQPWVSQVRVGRIVAPDSKWIDYCASTGHVAVEYAWGVMYDSADSLHPTDHVEDYWIRR